MEENARFDKLKKNLMDTLQEFQIKLGDSNEAVGLYYPIESLNRLLDTALDEAGMRETLNAFSAWAAEELGAVSVSNEGSRFCLRIPKEGAAYVRAHYPESGFLRDFIGRVSHFGAGIEDILGVFRRYSDRVVCRKLDNAEFDYLIYFEDGQPDDYRYCVKFEGGFATYHRFTPEDYLALGF